MTSHVYNKISELKAALTEAIKATPNKKFPFQMVYQAGLTENTYRITIEVVEQESFIDSYGTKWIRDKTSK